MGIPVDIDKINKVCKKYGLNVIEDSAQAHGTIYKNKKTGSNSLFSIFSFYIAHNIQVGEMGAVNSDNDEFIQICRKMKTNGRMCSCLVCTRNKGTCPLKKDEDEDMDPRFTHDIIAYNFKTMEFQGALARLQLKNVESIIKKRNENVKYLNEELSEFEDILKLPYYSKDISYLAYPLIIKKPEIISRKKLRTKLEEKNIENRPLFGSIPTQQPAYQHLKEEYKERIPNADYIGLNGFYIGCHQYLGQKELDYIVSSFKEILK
jgi:dTDP-4-amino-4,6-dideoxygalactose transaminase